MPWQEMSPMTERERFIADERRGLYTMRELCARYGVSRKTGYKWPARYAAEGRRGLGDRSRAPKTCPHRIAPEVAQVLCEARQHHPSWGPTQAVALVGAPISRAAVASGEHRRGSARPPRPGRRNAAAAARTSIPAWCRSTPRRRTISGPPTSRATSAPATGSTAIRSPSPTSTRASCSPVMGSAPPTAMVCARSSSSSSESMASPPRSVPTTAFPSPRAGSTVSRGSTSGGCVSGSSTSASALGVRNRTGPTNGCTRVSRPAPSGRRADR